MYYNTSTDFKECFSLDVQERGLPKEKPKPYVGVTGLITPTEVAQVATDFREAGLSMKSGYIPALGFVVSNWRLDNPMKAGWQCPAAADLPSLARQTVVLSALPIIHYRTSNPRDIDEELSRLFSMDGMYEKGYCRAVQLNVDWPPPDVMQRLATRWPAMLSVLRLSDTAMSSMSVEDVLRRCTEYNSVIDYIFIDPSGGRGRSLELSKTIELMIALRETLPAKRLGVAGGFDGQAILAQVPVLKKAFSDDFSLDAQGRLRTDRDNAINLVKAKRYIDTAASVLLKQPYDRRAIL